CSYSVRLDMPHATAMSSIRTDLIPISENIRVASVIIRSFTSISCPSVFQGTNVRRKLRKQKKFSCFNTNFQQIQELRGTGLSRRPYPAVNASVTRTNGAASFRSSPAAPPQMYVRLPIHTMIYRRNGHNQG